MALPSVSAALPRFAWRSVGPALVALAVALLTTAERYGYHRDELYVRMLPHAWASLSCWVSRPADPL